MCGSTRRFFKQKNFIVNSLSNVEEALRDGFILVIIVLFLFLLNFRTTIITLTAIPLSLVITALVFKWFDISINTLTLGGLAIAIGELVDDAIVDVENVFRRLRENREHGSPDALKSSTTHQAKYAIDRVCDHYRGAGISPLVPIARHRRTDFCAAGNRLYPDFGIVGGFAHRDARTLFFFTSQFKTQ